MKTQFNSLINRVDTRLAACAAAIAGAAVAAPPAKAVIIWSGPVNVNIPSDVFGVYLNVVTGLNNPDASLVPGWDLNPFGSTTLNMFTDTGAGGNGVGLPGGAYVGTAATYFNLAFGTVIGGASTFGGIGTNTIAGATPLNFSSSNNLIGFRFVNEAMANQVQFGWMRISLSATAAGQPRAIVEYAYQNDNTMTISAGQIPEPSTAALLGVMAAGALGVRAWRKRKAA